MSECVRDGENMADGDYVYCGTWKIVEFMPLSGSMEAVGIEGTEFKLDDNGDVSWKVAKSVEPMPFFNSETFKIFQGSVPMLKMFGPEAGHFIEFMVELSNDFLLLTYDNLFILQCQRVSHNSPKYDVPFSFLNALEEGYFCDLALIADNGKEFKAHRTILSLSAPQLDWNLNPPPLSGLPEDVLSVALHYMYSERLPATLTEDTAKQCLLTVGRMTGFGRLSDMCEMFLKSTALKQQIIMLVADMHTCATHIVDYFSGKPVECTNNLSQGNSEAVRFNSEGAGDNTSSGVGGTGSGGGGVGGSESLAANPAKLCYVMKQSLRECAVAGAKLLMLCDLFARRKNELSRDERHAIIKYAKSRVPVFMHQLHKFLEVAKQTFGDMKACQRHEIAMYLFPQIETGLETMSQFVIETKAALEQIMNTSTTTNKATDADRSGKKPMRDVLGKSLRHFLHMREMVKLRNFHDRITLSFMSLMQKKANFTNMTSANKVRSVAKNLEQIIGEIPVFLNRLEDHMATLDEKLTWRDWKYTFKLGTSKVAWILQKLVSHRATIRSVVLQACEMVHREQFTQSLVILGLLEPSQQQQQQDHPPSDSGNPTTSGFSLPAAAAPAKGPLLTSRSCGKRPYAMDSFSEPPMASESTLARNAIHLLKSGHGADMVFEIVCVEDVSDTVIDHTAGGEPVGRSTHEHEVELHHVRAHCVVIASRCDWFRRALLSGMRESIDKRIIVHDTNPSLFKIFLEYLYGGTLDASTLTTDELSDLMLMSDRYEVDSLKQLCEMWLKGCINHDSALFLLSIADQFNAKTLRKSALEFVTSNPEIIESDVFFDLPEDLQSEVQYELRWAEARADRRVDASSCCGGVERKSQNKLDDFLRCPNMEDMEDMISHMSLTGREVEPLDTSSMEDVPLTHDSAQLEACVEQMREFVGEAVPHDELVRFSLAADYDANRALNHFFASKQL